MLSVATIKISTKLKSVSVSGTYEGVNLWCSNINAFECKKKGSQQCSRYIWNQRGTRAGFVVAAVFVCCSRVVCVSWETCREGIHTHTQHIGTDDDVQPRSVEEPPQQYTMPGECSDSGWHTAGVQGQGTYYLFPKHRKSSRARNSAALQLQKQVRKDSLTLLLMALSFNVAYLLLHVSPNVKQLQIWVFIHLFLIPPSA